MPDPSIIEEKPRTLSAGEVVLSVLAMEASKAERIKNLESVLEAPSGHALRDEMGKWVIQFLPLEALVPEQYAHWRPLVQDAMFFFASHLSSARLAPKLLEQMELASDTNPEQRLLRLIAKVPGLQKLGQVLARNKHLPPALRKALSELENGISDVNADQVRSIIQQELGPLLDAHAVKIEPGMLSEASVSAVVRFTWHNPVTRCRERGVFKVLKPYIPSCFAEDMDLLARLAKHLGAKHSQYGFAPHVLPDTFNDVRRLLMHEVDFRREQATLLKEARLYSSVPGVRVPRLIQPLCTCKITAITEERGKKITDAVLRMPPWRRAHVSQQLVDALVAIPLFAPTGDVMFHADPHAGNLLYDRRRGELVVLDWALTEHLTCAERRHLAMLLVMIFLRDPVGASDAILALSAGRGGREKSKARIIRESVTRFLNELPVKHIPGAVDAMSLLESIAFEGVRLPASLVMFRKALFTLDGILHDIGAPDFSIESVMARHIFQKWTESWRNIGSPLSFGDWVRVHLSALLFPGRLGLQGVQTMLERPRPKPESPARAMKWSRKHRPVSQKTSSGPRTHTKRSLKLGKGGVMLREGGESSPATTISGYSRE